MGAPGVEADTGLTTFVHAHRELHLIAVAVHFRRTHNGQNRHIQSSDAGKGICNILLLSAQLGSIVQMPQAAAAAGACHGTIHRDTVRRRSEHLVQNTEGVALAVLNDAHPGFVAGGGTGNKHGLTVGTVCYAAAIAGKTLYAQGENLIFCKGMKGLLYWWSGPSAGASACAAKYLLGGTPLARLNTREK